MARCRKIGYRSALSCLLLATTVLSGCGVHIEAIAQPQMFAAAPAARVGPPPSASHIFSPCVPGSAEPVASAASAISDLLLGKDPYRAGCAINPDAGIRLDSVMDRAPGVLTPQPVLSTPAEPQTPGVLVTDELVSAVLTGTGEYWYQPIVGPA